MDDVERSGDADRAGSEDGVTAAPRPAGLMPGQDEHGSAQQAMALDGQLAPDSAAVPAQAGASGATAPGGNGRGRGRSGARRRCSSRPGWPPRW